MLSKILIYWYKIRTREKWPDFFCWYSFAQLLGHQKNVTLGQFLSGLLLLWIQKFFLIQADWFPKAKEPNLPYYLLCSWVREEMDSWSKTLSVSSRIWTQVLNFIPNVHNHFPKNASTHFLFHNYKVLLFQTYSCSHHHFRVRVIYKNDQSNWSLVVNNPPSATHKVLILDIIYKFQRHVNDL